MAKLYFEYAGLRLRLVAFAFDLIIIAGYILVTLVIGIVIAITMGPFPQPPSLLLDLIAFLTAVLPVALYLVLQECSPRPATWGKRRKGLRVVMADGRPLSLGRSLVRSTIKFLPWQIAHVAVYRLLWVDNPPAWVTLALVLLWTLVGVYLVSLLVTRTHRAPYDWLAGSFVIVGRRDDYANSSV